MTEAQQKPPQFRSCESCHWWVKLENLGECRADRPRAIDSTKRAIWPQTKPDEWCASFFQGYTRKANPEAIRQFLAEVEATEVAKTKQRRI